MTNVLPWLDYAKATEIYVICNIFRCRVSSVWHLATYKQRHDLTFMTPLTNEVSPYWCGGYSRVIAIDIKFRVIWSLSVTKENRISYFSLTQSGKVLGSIPPGSHFKQPLHHYLFPIRVMDNCRDEIKRESTRQLLKATLKVNRILYFCWEQNDK